MLRHEPSPQSPPLIPGTPPLTKSSLNTSTFIMGFIFAALFGYGVNRAHLLFVIGAIVIVSKIIVIEGKSNTSIVKRSRMLSKFSE